MLEGPVGEALGLNTRRGTSGELHRGPGGLLRKSRGMLEGRRRDLGEVVTGKSGRVQLCGGMLSLLRVFGGEIDILLSGSFVLLVVPGRVSGDGALLRRRLQERLLSIGYGRRLCDGEGETAKFAPAGDADAPGQLGLVTGALVPDLEALRAVGPPPVALDASLGAGEAVVGSAAGGSAPPALPGGRGIPRGVLRGGHVGGTGRAEEGIYKGRRLPGKAHRRPAGVWGSMGAGKERKE